MSKNNQSDSKNKKYGFKKILSRELRYKFPALKDSINDVGQSYELTYRNKLLAYIVPHSYNLSIKRNHYVDISEFH